MGPSRDEDWGASGSKHVITVFAPRKVLCKSSCWEWPHPACPRESGCGQALGLTPAACPAFSPPIPSFHQMLGLEDEMALPTPVPAACLSSSRSGAWIRPCRLNKAEPLSGSPRRASLIWPSRLAKSRQRMAAAPGWWGPSLLLLPPQSPRGHCHPLPSTSPPSLPAPQNQETPPHCSVLHPKPPTAHSITPSAPRSAPPWGGASIPGGIRASLGDCSQGRAG